MKTWVTRIGRALGMGLGWAAGWAIVGVFVALFVDPQGRIDDMWVATLGMPGLACGIVFAGVLGVVERRRGFAAVPLATAALCGFGTGLVMGALPFGLGTPSPSYPLWPLVSWVVGSATVLSAISSVVSVLVVRYAMRMRSAAKATA